MRLYLDEDLSPAIAAGLRRRGIDARSAHDVGNLGLSDRQQLSYAAAERRCLVTRNARDFVALSQDAIRRQAPHAGILLCSPRWTGAEIRRLVAALASVAIAYPAGLGAYDVLYL